MATDQEIRDAGFKYIPQQKYLQNPFELPTAPEAPVVNQAPAIVQAPTVVQTATSISQQFTQLMRQINILQGQIRRKQADQVQQLDRMRNVL